MTTFSAPAAQAPPSRACTTAVHASGWRPSCTALRYWQAATLSPVLSVRYTRNYSSTDEQATRPTPLADTPKHRPNSMPLLDTARLKPVFSLSPYTRVNYCMPYLISQSKIISAQDTAYCLSTRAD